MSTLETIVKRYGLDNARQSPVEIPGMGRADLAGLLFDLNLRTGAEIGVECGLYTEVLCRAGLRVYGVDPWQAYRGYRDHVSQAKLDGFYAEARDRLAGLDCELVRQFSLEAVRDFEDGGLDFVYIDGNHRLECVIDDIAAWERKVRKGGIVAGHDYRRFKRQTYSHVVDAVHAYTNAYRIRPWFVLGRKDDPGRDSARSWMWVR